MGLQLSRSYNAFWNARGLFGSYWLSNFDYTLVLDGDLVWAQRPDGRRIKFVRDSVSGHYLEEKASPIAYVVKNGDGSYTLFNEENGSEKYNTDGYILERRNEQGVAWTFTYSGKYLQQVMHSSGGAVKLAWSGGVVTQVTDPAGNIYRYTYTVNVFGTGDGYARLASTVRPGAPETTINYHYEDSRFPGALTGKSFNGVRYSTFAYDAEGRATSTVHAGEVERFGFSYAVASTQAVTPPPQPTPPGGFRDDESRGYCKYKSGTGRICYQPRAVAMQDTLMATQATAAVTAAATTTSIPKKLSVIETSPLGRKTTYTYVDERLTEVEGAATARCPASYKTKTYDAYGYENIVSDFADNLTDHDYDAEGHILKKVEAVGSAAERTTTYVWDTTYNRLQRETVLGDHETRYEYTADGRLAKQTVVDLTAHGQGRTLVTAYGYSKHANGLLSSVVVDGPLNGTDDALTYQYSDKGDLTSVSNGLGHKTTYANHNGLGQPGRVTGPNGDIAEYIYDERGRQTARREYIDTTWYTTSFSYNGSGLLASMIQPDGVTRIYFYDAALRLTEEAQAYRNGGYERKRYFYNKASLVTKVEVLETP